MGADFLIQWDPGGGLKPLKFIILHLSWSNANVIHLKASEDSYFFKYWMVGSMVA